MLVVNNCNFANRFLVFWFAKVWAFPILLRTHFPTGTSTHFSFILIMFLTMIQIEGQAPRKEPGQTSQLTWKQSYEYGCTNRTCQGWRRTTRRTSRRRISAMDTHGCARAYHPSNTTCTILSLSLMLFSRS